MANPNIIKQAKPGFDSNTRRKTPSGTERKSSDPVFEHDYAMETTASNKRERGDNVSQTTPVKTPLDKKAKSAERYEKGELSLKDVMEAIAGLSSELN